LSRIWKAILRSTRFIATSYCITNRPDPEAIAEVPCFVGMGIATVYGSLMSVGVDLVLLVTQTTMPIPLELTIVWSKPVCSSLTDAKSIPDLTI
jgi:hypothetical protein